MKTTRLLLAALLLLPCLARAQSQVPGLISYQGIVTDTGGNLVGNAAPVNREVFFRIWDNSTASLTGNLVYSERQVVTISKGEFSVLIGQGAAVTGTPLGYSETAKGPPTVTVATAFAGSGRYLGVTVDDGTAAADVEITPRQQMVSTAFTIRALEAEKLTSGTITGGTITGAVTATASTFTGGTFNAGTFAGTGSGLTALNASNISSGTLADARLSGNVSLLGPSIASAEITDGTIAMADLADASVTKVKLGADVGVWDIASGNAYRLTGNVGIGRSDPTIRLDVKSDVDTSVARFRGASSALHVQSNANTIDLVGRNAAEDSGKAVHLRAGGTGVYVDINGNVGIGTTVPAQKLDVVQATWPQLRLGLEPAAFAKRALNIGYHNSFGTDGGGAIMAEEQSNFFRDLYLSPYATAPNQGYVAIGQTTTPSHMLTVAGVCRSTQASFATSSDARVKEHITPLSESLERLMKLKPVNFDYIKAFQKGRGGLDKTQTGFIAQEVEKVFPDMVTQAVEKVGEQEIKDFRVLNTSSLTPHLVSATQELARKVEALEKANAEKDTALTAMTQRLAALEAKDKARDAKLATIEALLSGDKPAALPVSLKKSVGGAE